MAQQPMRSRCLRRCCPPRPGGKAANLKFPETPLVLAGAFGGPFCTYTLTPLRNALTLASQNPDSSAWALYATVFNGGFASGWTGGLAVLLPSCPQFCIMGPLYHFLRAALDSVVLAVLMSAMAETLISYASQTLNAQLAFNQEQAQLGSGLEVPLWNPFVPIGPGAVVHFLRNVVAMSGIRIFSGPCQALLRRTLRALGISMPETLRQFLSDFIASIGAAMVSAPLNQSYNFSVTSVAYMEGGAAVKLQELMGFLSSSYLSHGPSGEVTGISPTLARDLFMRCAYVATLFTGFGTIERIAQAVWKRKAKKDHPQLGRTNTVGVRTTA